jgi:hypothetical protein
MATFRIQGEFNNLDFRNFTMVNVKEECKQVLIQEAIRKIISNTEFEWFERNNAPRDTTTIELRVKIRDNE